MSSGASAQQAALDAAALSDEGTERPDNEDRCAAVIDGGGWALLVVADGVSSLPAGEVASQMAVDIIPRSFREQDPSVSLTRRMARAVQEANISIHDLGLAVPELRGMATTVTAAVVRGHELCAAHVGDCRLLLVRGGTATQLTKDHTVAGERARLGLLRKERLAEHPGRYQLTRSLGRELIVAVDQLTTTVGDGDRLVVCSDGLHGVLPEGEIARLAAAGDAAAACRTLIDAANAVGTPDNLTVAVLAVAGAPPPPARRGLLDRLRGLAGRR
ncbi:MAG TPA: protein phosphatase 2C domain-containing protein [Polyangia bacterium]|nr:protein phosphatase 2C domain-containing protein [Polyangia bacterium]